MDTKTLIAIGFIILLSGLFIGYMIGSMMVLTAVMDKALTIGNLSDTLKQKIKERCLSDWEVCF